MTADWPADIDGITESVITTRGPNDRWNVAALGLFAGDPVTARTWGNTRTRRNFHREGSGYVQFTRDPVTFVEAALDIREEDEPILETADAWVEVDVERIDAGRSEGTRWEEWALTPVGAGVEHRVVATINRGFNAVIEATVAASRLDVGAYDRDELIARIERAEVIVDRCGGERERAAFDQLTELAED